MSIRYEESNLMALHEASPEGATTGRHTTSRTPVKGLALGGCLLVIVATIGVMTGINNAALEKEPTPSLRSLTSTSQILDSSPSLCQPPKEGDPCSTNASYQQCLSVEAAGCQRIAASRSCPPGFVCLEQTEEEPEHPIVSKPRKCTPPTEDNHCDTETSYKECLGLEESGCQNLLATYSCPPQFRCGDVAPSSQQIEPSAPRPKSATLSSNPTSQCIKTTCDTIGSHKQCLDMERAGCQEIGKTRSCPPQYMCLGIPPTPIQPGGSQCLPPSPDVDCISEESYQECLALEASGCQTMIATSSCPPHFQCTDPPAETRTDPLLDTSFSTPMTLPAITPPSAAVCQHPDESDSACFTLVNYQQCMNLVEAGCQDIASTRSCPVQYLCFD